MRESTLNDAAAAPAALTAFLRGVERRGAVFAQLQSGGDADRVDGALAAAMRAFRNGAAQVPVAEWPRRFWTLLLASPHLRDDTRTPPRWPAEFAPLTMLGHGPRAALLLRLVAGLPDVDAAAVLGIARPTYRLALQRALPHREDGTPDEASWHALGEAAQQAIRHLPAERLAHLARLREAAILGRRLDPLAGRATHEAVSAPPRWWLPVLAGTAFAMLVALATTFVIPDSDPGLTGDVRIRVRPLPPAEAPAATFDAETALLTQRDFEMLADDAASAASRDPAFHAWLAALTDDQRARDGKPLSPADALASQQANALSAAGREPETSDAP